MTTDPDPRPCLTCGRPHGVDGWNPRHMPRYFEPTRPEVNMPAGTSHMEREFKFTTRRGNNILSTLLRRAGFEPIRIVHVYVSPLERLGRRFAADGSSTYIRTTKTAPPESTDIPPGTPLERREQNSPLTAAQWANAAARVMAGEVPFLSKLRYDVPLEDGSGLIAEVDLYQWPMDGPVVIEVEVPSSEDRYITPDDLPRLLREGTWEVTQDPAYYAANIAQKLPSL